MHRDHSNTKQRQERPVFKRWEVELKLLPWITGIGTFGTGLYARFGPMDDQLRVGYAVFAVIFGSIFVGYLITQRLFPD